MASPIIKGTKFEVLVSTTLLHSFKSKGVTFLSNLKIYSHYLQRPTEIDRLFITPWKIYSLEAKSYSTGLFGNITDPFWLGLTGRAQTKVYNPVTQNFEHIRSLNNNIRRARRKPFKIENIVVVPDGCRIESDYDKVLTLSQLLDMVLSDSYGQKEIDVSEVIESISRIEVY